MIIGCNGEGEVDEHERSSSNDANVCVDRSTINIYINDNKGCINNDNCNDNDGINRDKDNVHDYIIRAS